PRKTSLTVSTTDDGRHFFSVELLCHPWARRCPVLTESANLATVPRQFDHTVCGESPDMWHNTLSRICLVALLLLLPAGCSSNNQTAESASAEDSGAAIVPLTAADLERFLA